MDIVKIGLLSISDRASAGVYEDKGVPALKDWLDQAIINPVQYHTKLVPDEKEMIEKALKDLTDAESCDVVFTTGGTGPAKRDITPEATLAVADREMPGFGEQMRQISLQFVPTAILSRQTAVIRGKSLILNLPGQPKAIAETLGGIRAEEDQKAIHGIFSAVPYCLDLLNGPYIETQEAFCKAFRPKSAVNK